jgi:hypothetical protein
VDILLRGAASRCPLSKVDTPTVSLPGERRRDHSRKPLPTHRRRHIRWLVAEPVPVKKGTRMYPTSKRKWIGCRGHVVLRLRQPSASTRSWRQAWGGSGHGSSGYGDGGGYSSSGGADYGGYHLSSGRSGYSGFGARLLGPDGTQAHLIVDSPGFPEDLPEARIHRFLRQRLFHPHPAHWLPG